MTRTNLAIADIYCAIAFFRSADACAPTTIYALRVTKNGVQDHVIAARGAHAPRRIRSAAAGLSHSQQSDFWRLSRTGFRPMVRALRRAPRRDEDGQDLLEYALLVALIAIVAVASVTAAGLKVGAIFTSIVSKLP
jgi:Flp pilus assembly pilin Flp